MRSDPAGIVGFVLEKMSDEGAISLPKVLLGDHHPVVLAGLRSLLPNFCDVIGEATDGRALVASALSLRPDLIILAIGLPQLNGIEAARQIKNRWPAARLLFFTMHSELGYLRHALDAGAAGYLLKTALPEELETGIQTVLRGGRYISSAFAKDVLEEIRVRKDKPADASVRLSERQRQILQMITEGRSNKEIASILHLSVKTVEFHRVRLMQKLRVHTAAELAVAALRNHLVVESEALTIAGQMLDKGALEGLWHARLAEVKLRFDEASVHVKDIQNKFGTDVSSDGALALVQALREQNRILAEYNRVLRIYNDLTVYGRAPDEI